LPLPKKVSLGQSQVAIDWSDGHKSVYGARNLREACPCASCKGEPPAIGTSRTIPLIVAAPEGVTATSFSLVGRYAIAFVWSDGHSSGIYPYDYILGICECERCARGSGRRS